MPRLRAVSLGLSFKRLQCTPDLLPNDILGVSVFNPKSQDFEFHPGPVFVNILLADEINRATPRTQSALLEAMQERQVTVDGVPRSIGSTFLVLATQNPIEFEGTFPLPEAQLDRFMLRIPLGYPTRDDEIRILRSQRQEHPIDSLSAVANPAVLAELEACVGDVHVDGTVERYLLDVIAATRAHPDLALGASPRGSLALYKAVQARAAIQGRDFVLPDDIKALAACTLAHRLLLKPESQLRGRTQGAVLAGIMESVELDLGLRK